MTKMRCFEFEVVWRKTSGLVAAATASKARYLVLKLAREVMQLDFADVRIRRASQYDAHVEAMEPRVLDMLETAIIRMEGGDAGG